MMKTNKLFATLHMNMNVTLLFPQRGLLQRMVFLSLAILLSACTFSRAQSPVEEIYRPVRSPYPTFTPTPLVEPPATVAAPVAEGQAVTNNDVEITAEPTVAAPSVPAETPASVPEPTQAPTLAPPRLVVTSPLVNVRAGPGTEYPVITTIERGEEFDIVGKDAPGTWWRFCCIDDQPAWVIDELVDADGAVDSVPVSDAIAQVPPTATPPPAAPAAPQPEIPAEPAPTEPPPPPAFSFELQNVEQFPENKLVRIFLYVFDGAQALDGFSVRVIKDGSELTVDQRSAGGQPSLTWPIADTRQRFQNMKVEFPGVAPAGTWVVQLVDGAGNLVGPPATFTLNANDPSQELYVRYKKL